MAMTGIGGKYGKGVYYYFIVLIDEVKRGVFIFLL